MEKEKIYLISLPVTLSKITLSCKETKGKKSVYSDPLRQYDTLPLPSSLKYSLLHAKHRMNGLCRGVALNKKERQVLIIFYN